MLNKALFFILVLFSTNSFSQNNVSDPAQAWSLFRSALISKEGASIKPFLRASIEIRGDLEKGESKYEPQSTFLKVTFPKLLDRVVPEDGKDETIREFLDLHPSLSSEELKNTSKNLLVGPFYFIKQNNTWKLKTIFVNMTLKFG